MGSENSLLLFCFTGVDDNISTRGCDRICISLGNQFADSACLFIYFILFLKINIVLLTLLELPSLTTLFCCEQQVVLLKQLFEDKMLGM